MQGVTIQSILRLLGVGALVLGLAGPALAQEPPPAGPVEDIQATLGIILDRLDDIEAKGGPCEVPPVWGKKYAGADRFVAVLDGAAYCDQETGLVWSGAPNDDTQTWAGAISHCAILEVDDRKGWQLPLREQLATLVDTQSALCVGGGPCLPDDHPFQNVQSGTYWSASTNARNPTLAWVVDFFFGDVVGNGKGDGRRAWCVRGDQSFDGNTHTTLH